MTERGSCAPEHAHALALFAIVDPGGVYSSGLAVVSADAPGEAAQHAGEQAALLLLRHAADDGNDVVLVSRIEQRREMRAHLHRELARGRHDQPDERSAT